MTDKPPIFVVHTTDYRYNSAPISIPTGENLYLPLELDTEFEQPSYKPGIIHDRLNITITGQIRSPFIDEGKIFAHPDILDIARHDVLKHQFIGQDYLEYLGYDVVAVPNRGENDFKDAPTLFLDCFTFFAVAELFRVFQGEMREDIRHLCLFNEKSGIEQGRRLRTFTQSGRNYQDWVMLPWVWILQGIPHKLALRIFDSCAVQGNTNYATLCANSGIDLKYKDNFNSDEKSRMVQMYLERPEDFDNYALGDLYNHAALMGNAANFEKIYESLGISEYYTLPRLTIGATVSRIIEAKIKKLFDVPLEDKEVIKKYCHFASADRIKRMNDSTAALNAKVDGGRCRNNRPTHTFATGTLCDIDISGCYGEGLRSQMYPFGIPVIHAYPAKSDRNNYLTLRQFLKEYGNELVPGLWQCRVSLKPDYILKYKQDFLISWMPPRDISKMTTDSEFAETDEWWTIDNTGETKIFNKEIINAIITHDFMQWLDNVATARQRKELLDNLIVVTAAYYPKSEQVESIDDLKEAHKNHKGKNSFKAVIKKGKTKTLTENNECHAWYAVNLGELLVDDLLKFRKQYPKKTPFNELYKLCTNTVYGDMVSPFFKVGNVVVGNNITARARALAWYMEKGLHGWQSITDGCVFDVNRVAYPSDGRRLTGENTVDLYRTRSGDVYILLQPLTDSELSVTVNNPNLNNILSYSLKSIDEKPVLLANKETETIELTNELALNWINIAAFNHLKRLFPNVDVLHKLTADVYGKERIGQFEFEAKGFYDSGTFHGTANYCLWWNGEEKIAMRSYSKRPHPILEMNDVVEIVDEKGRTATTFLTALRDSAKVERSRVYVKSRILKCTDYRRNYTKWRESVVFPGMTIEQSTLLREFSLSQFTFDTLQQYDDWGSEYDKLLNKHHQSYEALFLNGDGTLNYQAMVNEIDELIREGKHGYFDGVDKRATNASRLTSDHPHERCFAAVKAELEMRYAPDFPGDEGCPIDIYVGKAME